MTATTRQPAHYPALTSENFDAVLFDLDGVITATNQNHFAAWKRLFDGYLQSLADAGGAPFREFTEDEMSEYVDGKPRYEGIRSFLDSRGLSLPYGDPDDPETARTVCGLGNLKNRFFNESIEADGVTVFQSTVDLIRALKGRGIRCAVVSSSKNCTTVLKAAGLTGLFDTQFDGTHAAELKLTGKPDPDTYLKAAEWLGVDAARAVVVEDAISGVQAGKAGGFGLVIGIDRAGVEKALYAGGADVVVKDLGQLKI